MVLYLESISLMTLSGYFPNLDLQIHLHRLPQGRWLGLETVQQIGQDGVGLTSGSVLPMMCMACLDVASRF